MDSKATAEEFPVVHYDNYRKIQDAEYVSDFDRQVKLLLGNKDR